MHTCGVGVYKLNHSFCFGKDSVTSQSKDRKTVFIHVIDVCLQLTSSRDLQELNGGGLNEIDLKIHFHTYNVQKKRKVKNKESVLPGWSRLFKCLTDYTSKMMIPARTGCSRKRVLDSRRDQKYFFELIFLVEHATIEYRSVTS